VFGVPEPSFPTVLPERCRAIGFLCAARGNKRCKPPKELKKRYHNLISEYTLSEDTLSYLRNVTWEDPYRLSDDESNQFHLSFHALNKTAIVGSYASNVLLERPPYVDPKIEKCPVANSSSNSTGTTGTVDEPSVEEQEEQMTGY